ncbi:MULTISPECIES: hypothetical protein [Emticicia]|uniref:hypothetical protein n=1 Tax=Emticicia TaxID=312278 RepID=UPI0007D8BAF7|nr:MULTISPECIES: hypothetical protein [Emticicia]
MDALKSIKYLSVAVLLSTWGCTSTKQLTTKGEYDDTYGSSKDAPVVAYTPKQTPEYLENQRYQPEEPQQNTGTGTDEYYDENYVNSRKVYRNNNGSTGYASGFANGYQSGWNDYAWSQPVGWSSPYSMYGYNSPFGYNLWGRSSWNLGLGFGLGGFNSFYDPFWNSYGYNSFYSPWGYNSFYNPWGYNSFNSPWGLNSWYSPYSYGYYDRFAYGYGNNVFVNNYYNNVTSGVNGASTNRRTYGPRDGGSGSSNYNRGFTNAAVNTGGANASSGRSANARGAYDNSGYARPSRNGDWNGSSASREYTRGASRSYDGNSSNSNDTYYRPRRNGGTEGSYSSGNSNGGYNYSRPSSSSRSSDNWSSGSGNYSRGSSNSNSNSNSSWSNSNSGSFSRGSSSGWSGSSGGGSSSSGGGGGGGGSSRGPR